MQNVQQQDNVTSNNNSARELYHDFKGESVNLDEAMKLIGKSKVTVMKIMKDGNVPIVGKYRSGGRGRPGHLYDKASFMNAWHTVTAE